MNCAWSAPAPVAGGVIAIAPAHPTFLRLARRVAPWVVLAIAPSLMAEPLTTLHHVNVMPARYARAQNPVTVWGNVNRGRETVTAGFIYTWSFAHDGSVAVDTHDEALSGPVDDGRDIHLNATFTLLGASTSSVVDALLTVDDGAAIRTAGTRITVVDDSDPADEAIEIERKIAIEQGLRYLYLTQEEATGRWSMHSYGEAGHVGLTATVLWAFANAGHTPLCDADRDIYQPTVEAGWDYLFGRSEYRDIATTAQGPADANGNGKGVVLGGVNQHNDGYTRGMCLAALCSWNAPEAVIHSGPFANDGAGTACIDIVQDAADFIVWCLGNNEGGGWGYTYEDMWWADTSIASWNYVALEAAMQMGATVPSWAPAHCESLLNRAFYRHGDSRGAFGYMDDYIPTGPATSGAGLAGLTYLALDGRQPGLDVGVMKLLNLRLFGGQWTGFTWYGEAELDEQFSPNHGYGYQMWTIARAMRMAHVRHLNREEGIFDWQRNRTIPGAGNEGFWPYLVRTQAADGSWHSRYGQSFETAWAVLCLSEGVIGGRQTLHNVEVTSTIPKSEDLRIVDSTFTGTVSDTPGSADSLDLFWRIEQIAEGDSVVLSYDLYLDNLTPGESRRVQKTVVVAYESDEAGSLEQRFGPLDVSVSESLYQLRLDAIPMVVAAGGQINLRATAELPPGPAFQRIHGPHLGTQWILPPVEQQAPVWTVLEFDLSNAIRFAANDVPVAIRARSAPTAALIEHYAFGPAITASGQPLSCPPGALLELDIALTPNAHGTAPELAAITAYYVDRPVKLVIEVLDNAGRATTDAVDFAVLPSDFGGSFVRSLTWTARTVLPGSYVARARVVEGAATKAEATRVLLITSSADVADLAPAVTTDRALYSSNEPVRIRSQVRNRHAHEAFERIPVRVEVLDPDGQAFADGTYVYTIAPLESLDIDIREFWWDTELREPGTYAVRQTLLPTDPDPVQTTVTFEIASSAEFNRGLTGSIAADPPVVEAPGHFNVRWHLCNTGNGDLLDLGVDLKVVMPDDPLNSASAKTSNMLQHPCLAKAEVLTQTWSTANGGAMLPLGQYLLLLEVRPDSREGMRQTVAVNRVAIVDTTPPVTEHDYASANAWVNTDPTITLTATEPEGASGVKQTSYTVGGHTLVGSQFTVTDEGTTHVVFRSEDHAGNIEQERTLEVKLDKSPPTITHDYTQSSEPVTDPVTINFSATDTLSGIAEEWYRLDGGGRQTGTVVTVSGIGEHNVILGASDNAGNENEIALSVSIAEQQQDDPQQDDPQQDDGGTDQDEQAPAVQDNNAGDPVGTGISVSGVFPVWDLGSRPTPTSPSPDAASVDAYGEIHDPHGPPRPSYRPPRSTVPTGLPETVPAPVSPPPAEHADMPPAQSDPPSREQPQPARLAGGAGAERTDRRHSPQPPVEAAGVPLAAVSGSHPPTLRRSAELAIKAGPDTTAALDATGGAPVSRGSEAGAAILTIAKGTAAVGAVALLLVGFLCRRTGSLIRLTDDQNNTRTLHNPDRQQVLEMLNLYLSSTPKVREMAISAPLVGGRMFLRNERDYRLSLTVPHGDATLSEVSRPSADAAYRTEETPLVRTLAEILQPAADVILLGRGEPEAGRLPAANLSDLLPGRTVHSAFRTGLASRIFPHRPASRPTRFRDGREVTE